MSTRRRRWIRREPLIAAETFRLGILALVLAAILFGARGLGVVAALSGLLLSALLSWTVRTLVTPLPWAVDEELGEELPAPLVEEPGPEGAA